MKQLIIFCLLTISGLTTTAQEHYQQYHKRWLVSGPDTLPWRIMYPEGYDGKTKFPVIFFLHGAGERGNDNTRQLIHGSKLFANEKLRQQFPAIVIMPQCSTSDYWSNVLRMHDSTGRFHVFQPEGQPTTYMNLLQLLVGYVLDSLPVKKDQVYVGGLSMGGMGTFELVRRRPDTFAAAFPICGGAHPASAKNMTTIQWWIFHGAKDNVVDPQHSERMVKALKAAGKQVKYTLYPEANHNSWDPAFAESDLLPWLFSQRKQ